MAFLKTLTFTKKTLQSIYRAPCILSHDHISVRGACHMSHKKRRRLRRQDRDLSWADPILQYQKESQGHGSSVEPHMLHVIWRVRSLQGRPWWEKDIINKLGLDGKTSTPVIHKNIPSINEQLKEVKHLLVIKPLTFPHGLPEHESDFENMYIKPSGEAIVKKRITCFEPSTEGDENKKSDDKKWKLTLDTVRKECDRIRVNYEIHSEYHKAEYVYKKNQDGKEHRYNYNKDYLPYSY